MKKKLIIVMFLFLILLTGCVKEKKLEGNCFFGKSNGLGYCFEEEGNKGYYILKYENNYRGTKSEDDIVTWEEKDDVIIIKHKSSSMNLENNKVMESKTESKYKYNDKDKTLAFISEDDTDYEKLQLSDIKLSDIKFDDDIKLPVTFMGEKVEAELSNYYMVTLINFTLPIKNLEVNSDYVFKMFGLEVFYLPVDKFNEFNNNDYRYIYRNLFSKYRLCYETDLGKYYYNKLEKGYYLTEDITYFNVDYCSNMGISDNVDVKNLYASFAGKCFAKSGRDLMCFNNDMTKVYFETGLEYGGSKLDTYNLEIKDGLYMYNNISILILNSKSVAGNYDKLRVGSDKYSLFGDTAGNCVLCPEYVDVY